MAKEKKKRTKKNNPLKRNAAMAKFGTSDLLLIFASNLSEALTLDKKVGSYVPIGPFISSSLDNVEFRWHVYLAVLRRDVNGVEYIDAIEEPFKVPVRKDRVNEYLNDLMDELVFSCQEPDEILNLGWIASTTPYKFNDRYCYDLFKSVGAWESLADWEKRILIN